MIVRSLVAMLMLLAASGGSSIASSDQATLGPGQRETLLAEAQASYDQGTALLRTDPEMADGHFEDAAARFQLLVDEGVRNGDLFYNLGNAYFQSGDLGLAIANYLVSQSFSPRNPRLVANLAYARSLVRPQIAGDGSDALLDRLTAWHEDWPLAWRLGLFATCWLIVWLAVAARMWFTYPGFPWIVIGSGLLAVIFGVSAASSLVVEPTQRLGVVTADAVVVRKGNAESFSPQFEKAINRGIEFRLLEERPDWLHVELANGQSGWIRRSTAVIIDGSEVRPAAG